MDSNTCILIPETCFTPSDMFYAAKHSTRVSARTHAAVERSKTHRECTHTCVHECMYAHTSIDAWRHGRCMHGCTSTHVRARMYEHACTSTHVRHVTKHTECASVRVSQITRYRR
eukprot:Tamp_28719.p2 GENE.Tamp_28719~~Tamp_28719.p2  ORF type:complete len:115 (-),score=0.76 Tamp_28719:436-780(-)